MDLKQSINKNNIPRHVAIIMDGNGRWAKQHGEDRIFGHHEGVNSVRDIVEACGEIGVKFLTLYAFSTENWNRPQDEVEGLMSLLVYTIANEVAELNAQNVRLLSIGDTAGLPEDCQNELYNAVESTKNNTGVHLVIALNYSSRSEIADTVKTLALQVKEGKLDASDITPELISASLSTKHIPDPELLIRTSGEHRLSNFLLWQAAYSEFYFTPVLWPDFREEDLYKAVLDYQSRERRFGMVSEQL